MSHKKDRRPNGQVRVPTAAIGLLSMLLVFGLSALGILARFDHLISGLVLRGRVDESSKTLATWAVYLATVIFGFGLSFAILGVPGTWRRVVLWITTVVLVAGWAPVLSLAGYFPAISAPLLAAFWTGICALIYAGNHQMACDESVAKILPDPSHETR